MGNLTQYANTPTVDAIYKEYENKQSQKHRPHLGGSQIGHPCDRYLWYQHKWCDREQFEGRMLRLFDHGNVEEGRLVRDLRSIGVTVYDVDPNTGRQWLFTAFGGHFGLSLDGAGQGFPESSAWHALEFKTYNDKGFAQLQKHGVEKHKPQHAAQMQIGMELADLDRAFYLAVNKNTDALYGERLKRDPKQGQRLLDRAERVIFSEEPLEKISERPDWYECKYCPMYKICHQGGTAEVNCRTCVHSTAQRDGTWHCARHDKTLSTKEQREGCGYHLFRPHVMGHGEATDAGDDWIEYQGAHGTFRNGVERGKGVYTSAELRAGEIFPLPDELEEARLIFDGEVMG